MAFSQADLDDLDSMIATGVLEAEFNGRKTKFDSFRQLKSRRQFIKKEIDLAAGNPSRIRSVRVSVNKGL